MDGAARRERLARSRLYLVVEARPHGRDPSVLLDAALRGGVDLVQLRDKELGDGELVAAAAPFREACARHGALFVLNDRPDLVEACGADGVHVGQEDTPAAEARAAVGPLGTGGSCDRCPPGHGSPRAWLKAQTYAATRRTCSSLRSDLPPRGGMAIGLRVNACGIPLAITESMDAHWYCAQLSPAVSASPAAGITSAS